LNIENIFDVIRCSIMSFTSRSCVDDLKNSIVVIGYLESFKMVLEVDFKSKLILQNRLIR